MNNWLILGLGNPDKKYEKTKHNVPWWVLDILENKFSKNKQYEKNEKNHFEVHCTGMVGDGLTDENRAYPFSRLTSTAAGATLVSSGCSNSEASA